MTESSEIYPEQVVSEIMALRARGTKITKIVLILNMKHGSHYTVEGVKKKIYRMEGREWASKRYDDYSNTHGEQIDDQ